jgi:transposase
LLLALEDVEQSEADAKAKTEAKSASERTIAAKKRTHARRRFAFASAAHARLRGRLVQSPAPARLIEGGLSTEAKVSEVLVSKFADYLPLHRQARFYGRQGVCADETTAPVLDPARGRTKIGQLWTFARDDWPGADRIHPRSSMSTLQTGKRRSESRTLLASRAFSGRIYAGYRLLAEKGLCPTCFLLTARAAAVLRTRRRRPSADRK